MSRGSPLEEYLRKSGVDARVIFFEGHVKTVAAAAKRLGVDPGRIVKSILFIDDTGAPILAIIRGDARVSEYKLAKLVGARRVRIAAPEEVRLHTGYEAGAVPPVGIRAGVRVVVDAAVASLDRVFAGGGLVNSLVEISPADILRLTRGLVGDIAAPL